MSNEWGLSFRAASVIISACKSVIEHDRACKDYLSFKSKEHLWCAQYFWRFSQPFFPESKINILYLAKLLSCSERGIPDMHFCLAGNEVEVALPEAILSYHEGPHANIWFLPNKTKLVMTTHMHTSSHMTWLNNYIAWCWIIKTSSKMWSIHWIKSA